MSSREPAKPRLVLDTSVLIAALLSDSGASAHIVELVLSGKVHSFYTDEIIEELRQVLRRPKFGLSRELQDHFVHVFAEASFPIEPIAAFRVTRCRDAKDDKFLSLARQVEAEYLVSLDDDLLELKVQGTTKIRKPSFVAERLRKPG